jgi:hypothetical protein
MVAYQRSGDVHAARAVLADMQTQGFAAAQLAQYEHELHEPPPEDLQALEQRTEPTAMVQRRDCGADDGERLPHQCHSTGMFAARVAAGCAAGVNGVGVRQTGVGVRQTGVGVP